jgi:hypothetical protein
VKSSNQLKLIICLIFSHCGPKNPKFSSTSC